MKYSVLLATFFAGTSFAAGAEPTSLVECLRERPTFKQFCKIRNDAFNAEVRIPVQKVLEDGQKFDFANILKSASYSQKDAKDKDFSIDLPGLSPLLTYNADWALGPSGGCAATALWQHRISATITDAQGTLIPVMQLQNGVAHNSHDLLNFMSDSVNPWKSTLADQQLTLSTTLQFIDNDFVAELPVERIPLSCNLKISGVQLTYDAVKINQTLQFLKDAALTKAELLTRAYVLNANIRGQKKGMLCAVGSLADALRYAEVLGQSDPYTDLSLSSRTAIIKALKEASGLGALPNVASDDTSLWNYFISATSRSVFFDSCGTKENYTVNSGDFVSGGQIFDQQGYNNARTYERESSNLKEVLNAAWALIKASEVALDKVSEITWPETSELTINLPRE